MLDLDFILENKEIIEKTIENKGKGHVDFPALEALRSRRLSLVQEINDINRQKKLAAESRDIEKGRELKERSAPLEKELVAVTKDLTAAISAIPNVPLADVPVGKDESENVVIRSWGEKREFSFAPKPHWELGKELDIIDNERGAKVAGSRFTYLKGGLARMQFALMQWVFEMLARKEVIAEVLEKNDLSISNKTFVPVVPPVFITPEMFFGMARLEPRDERYYIPDDNLFLIGSAEHTLGAMHADETFNEDDLPLRYIGYSTAFRREAGSYGKDTKGIIRLHQFDKLEFESFTVAEQSREEQDFLVALQEHLVQQLGIPYQVVSVCTGDMGGPDMRQIDIEMWMPGENKFRETHSADLMGEYQARRLGIKVRRNTGAREFVHMNDATVFAIGRTLVAIVENNQNEDGSIAVPNVLRPYMGNLEVLR